MLLTEEQVNFAAFKVENDELKMQVKEQQEQIKKLEAQVEVLMKTIHGKMEG
jgi:tetrahydromethanopterin S-methyltransferase subunit B